MVWPGTAPPTGCTLRLWPLSEENLAFCRALRWQRHYIKLILLNSLLSLLPFFKPNLLSWDYFQGAFQSSRIGQSLNDHRLRLTLRFSRNFFHHHFQENKFVDLGVKVIHICETEFLFIRCQICARPIFFLNKPPLQYCIQFRSLLSFNCLAYSILCSLLTYFFILLSL